MNRKNVSTKNTINEPKESFLEKIQKHKKKIIITGTFIVGGITSGIIIWKMHDAMKIFSFEETTKPAIPIDTIPPTQATPETNTTKRALTCAPFTVQGYLRNLPEKCHASHEQLELAKSLGINPGPNQTFVRPHMKCASPENN